MARVVIKYPANSQVGETMMTYGLRFRRQQAAIKHIGYADNRWSSPPTSRSSGLVRICPAKSRSIRRFAHTQLEDARVELERSERAWDEFELRILDAFEVPSELRAMFDASSMATMTRWLVQIAAGDAEATKGTPLTQQTLPELAASISARLQRDKAVLSGAEYDSGLISREERARDVATGEAALQFVNWLGMHHADKLRPK